MKKYNCIVVFDSDKNHILFCKRTKEPYQGLYNFVGGKVEADETSKAAAYRELYEETGITQQQIQLFHFMDLTYYHQSFVLELFVGQLHSEVNLKDEVNPLEWLSLEEDFADSGRFAGDQNIAHIVNVALMYPLDQGSVRCSDCGLCIGVDGCNKGWIAAIFNRGNLQVERQDSIVALIEKYPVFDELLIDMAIGLPESKDDKRPDSAARKLLGSRASTVFAVPCRQAVHVKGEEKQKEENIRILGKSLAKQTMAIIPKMKELDDFFTEHSEYNNKLAESHPEVCFMRLGGYVLKSRKKQKEGQQERIRILSHYISGVENLDVNMLAKQLECNVDDIVDAICLAVTANLAYQDRAETIHENPMADNKGLFMRMVIPKIG